VWFFDPHTGVSSPTVQPEIEQINKEKSNTQQIKTIMTIYNLTTNGNCSTFLKVEGQLKNIIAGFGTRQFNTI
jgi:hypothetical protein